MDIRNYWNSNKMLRFQALDLVFVLVLEREIFSISVMGFEKYI